MWLTGPCRHWVVLASFIPHLYSGTLISVLFVLKALQKKDTSVTFWAERIFFCHTYDTSMTIIVTKPGIIIDVVGSYFYDKKIMAENGLFVLGGPET